MSNGTGKETANTGLAILLGFGPAIISAVFALITKPFSEKSKFDLLRKSFLEAIRFRMAAEVAAILPQKLKKVVDDDYVEMCKTKLNEYFASNSDLLNDFLTSEKLYRSYVRFFKIFKYGIVLIPIIVILCAIFSYIYFRDIINIKNCGLFVAVLLVLLFLMWGLKEHKRDSYSDLCSKYEVTE